MKQIHNAKQIPLSLAVWLARDTYDYVSDPNYISATSLLKPLKSLVLASQVPSDQQVTDIHDLVPSRIGTAIHDSIEMAWKSERLGSILDSLGYNHISHKIKVNPPLDTLEKDIIPVYMEQRTTKELDGITVGGKYDFIMDGILTDFKSTSTYTYINKTNNEKYQLQGSIYRWLNPDVITADYMEIHYIFTDWKPTLADTQKDYPPSRAMAVKIPLLSIEETENFIRSKINQFKTHRTSKEEGLPACNDEELWRKESVWKYYRDLSKTARSTKNFNNASEAQSHAMAMSGKNPAGGVIEVKGQVVACKYCNAFPICKQKDQYIATGELTSF